MSEVLRDLVVSLSLNSDNFSRNLTSINRQVAEAESEFRRAAAGVDGFEKTVAGTRAQLSGLTQKLAAQRNAVAQYERALEAANTKLSTSVRKNGELKASLDAAKSKYSALKTRIDQTKAAYQASVKATGDNSEESNRLGLELIALEDQYKATGEEIKKLDGQLAASGRSLQNNADAVTKARTGLNQAQAALKQTEAQIKSANARLATLESAWTSAGNALTAFSKKASAASKTLTATGAALTRYGTLPILALGTAAVKASVSFESAFTSVRKTVDATEDEYAALSDSIKRMSTEVAASTESISEVMATAGQLGIQNQYLESFTRTMIDLGNSTDIAAADGAIALAQFANVTNMAQSQFGNFGSALVDLGNNFSTTESQILDMSTRLASAGSQVGLTQPQILGFATALSSVGLEAEGGGTAFSKAMIQMQVAVETGSKALDDFAHVSGMTNKAFSALWKTDPAGAIQAFIVGLSRMDEEGISAIATLEDMGLSEVRLRDTLLRATNASELFAGAQQTANSAWSKNTALSAEASKRYATTESKLKNLKNTAVLFAQQIGDDLNPTIQALIEGAGEMLEKFRALDESQRLQIIKYAGIAAAAGPALSLLGKATGALGKGTAAVGKFMTAVGKAGGGFSGFMSVVGSSPVVWLAVTAAVVAATAALVDYVSGAKQTREAMEGMNEVAREWENHVANTVYDKGGLSDFGLTAEDFAGDGTVRNMEAWKAGLIAVWTDGKNETAGIVRQWVDSFAGLNAGMIESLEEMRAAAEQNGDAGMSDSIQKDIDALNAMNEEVASLLKKRRNGTLTEKDKVRLDALIDDREAIQIKYTLTPDTAGTGYDQIMEQIEIEKARAQARGEKSVDPAVYEKALTASAQGYAAVTDAIDERYAAEYKLIRQMEDGEEKTKAQTALDARYNAERLAAARDYAAALKDLVPPVWNTEGIQTVGGQMDTLYSKFALLSTMSETDPGRPALFTEMENLTKDLNQDDLLSYIGMLQQAQDLLNGGMREADVQALFPDLDLSQNLDQLAALAKFTSDNKDDLEGLSKILNEIVPADMQEIAVTLNMEEAKAVWAEFAANPGAITTDAVIGKYAPAENVTVPQPVVDALVQSYGEIEAGASTAALKPDDVVAQVAKYLEGKGADVNALKPDQITAIVNAYSEATGCDKSTLMQAFTAYIAAYDDTKAAKPTVFVTAKVVALTGYDMMEYQKFVENNPVEVTGVVRLDSQFENPEDALSAGNVDFWKDGVQVPVSMVPKEQLTADTVAALDADGTLHVLLTPELTGSDEAIEGLREQVSEVDQFGTTALGKAAGIVPTTTMDMIDSAMERLASYQKTLDDGAWDKFWASVRGESTDKGVLDQSMAYDFSPERIAEISAYVTEIMTKIQSGESVAQEDLDNLQNIIDFLSALNTAGVGDNVVQGIADAMTAAGWETTAETVAQNLQDAVNGALEINSPSKRMKPTGAGVSEGVGAGMAAYSFATDAAAMADALESAVRLAITQEAMRTIGRNASLGLGLGILSGKAFVVAAITTVARAAVRAAKKELKISSPSGVFRDEVGRMTVRGMGVGAELEAKAQAKTFRNAARYLTGAAQSGVGGSAAYDNRKTYNYNAASAVQVDKLYVRDEQDIYALAVELASLTRRRQRGRGRRNA